MLFGQLLEITSLARTAIDLHSPEARQALIRKRIATIFAQMASDTDSPAEAREHTRPTWDSGAEGERLTAFRW